MKIFFYLPVVSSPFADVLEKKVRKAVPKNALQTFRNSEDLAWMLRRPWHRSSIAILVATDRRELEQLIQLQPLLKDIKVLLVLPDRETPTALEGHKLYPRFFTYLDSDPNEILAVLKKMIRNFQSQHQNRYKEVPHDTGHPDHGSGC
jgi:hypothetical protein